MSGLAAVIKARRGAYQAFDGDRSLTRMWYRARAAGRVTVYAGERMCDALRIHPTEVFGDAYYEAAA